MDKNGQMTFSDDPMLNENGEIYQLISEGNFREAIKKLDKLMNINPDYPGLVESYRTAKFWNNREKDIKKTEQGKTTADFLMEEWAIFDDYASSKNMQSSSAYKSAMKYIFFRASENYKIAFQRNEGTGSRLELLIKLGECFLRLGEYQFAVETLEHARNSYSANAKMMFILGTSYYHLDDIPKSLLFFKEAFLIDPSELNLSLIDVKPINDIINAIKGSGRTYRDIREWIPVYGFITDIFYVRRNINKHQMELLKNEVLSLEKNYVKLNSEEIESTNILPRMLNKYLWLLDYYIHQNINFENSGQIRERLLTLDRELFEEFLSSSPYKK